MLKTGYKTQKIIDSLDEKKHEITKKTIPVGGGEAVVLFIKQLTDMEKLSKFIIKPLVEHASSGQEKGLSRKQ